MQADDRDKDSPSAARRLDAATARVRASHDNEDNELTRSAFLSRSAALLGGAALLQAGIGCGGDDDPKATAGGDTSGLPDYEGRVLTISDFGGNISDAFRAAYYTPFEEATGATIRIAPTMTLGALKAQAAKGTPTWDVVENSPSQLTVAAKAGYVEPIDYAKVPLMKSRGMKQIKKYRYCVPWLSFSNVLAWNTDLVKETPAGWADLWDVEKFPGRRSYISYIDFGGLEPPLFADGVPADEVASVLQAPDHSGIQRAIEKLGELAPDISQWWAAGAEPAQALASGSVAMAYAWTGRIRPLVDDGAPINLIFDEGIVVYDGLGIVKGSKNADMGHTFINFCLDPQRQAVQAELTTYGPANRDAIKHISPDERKNVSTLPEHLDKQIYLNEDWLAKNYSYLSTQYTRALSGLKQ